MALATADASTLSAFARPTIDTANESPGFTD